LRGEPCRSAQRELNEARLASPQEEVEVLLLGASFKERFEVGACCLTLKLNHALKLKTLSDQEA
jgi:hypothetical protein